MVGCSCCMSVLVVTRGGTCLFASVLVTQEACQVGTIPTEHSLQESLELNCRQPRSTAQLSCSLLTSTSLGSSSTASPCMETTTTWAATSVPATPAPGTPPTPPASSELALQRPLSTKSAAAAPRRRSQHSPDPTGARHGMLQCSNQTFTNVSGDPQVSGHGHCDAVAGCAHGTMCS